MLIAHLWNKSIQHLGCIFKCWNVKEMLVGQFALEYLNNNSLHTGCINYVLHKTTVIGMCFHLYIFFTIFSVCLFSWLCLLYSTQMLFFNTSQQLKNRVGWLDDRRSPSPILYDTAPLFVYTDQSLRHCIFICSIVHYCGWFAQCNGFFQCSCLLAESYETINHCPLSRINWSMQKQGSQLKIQGVSNLLRGFTWNIDQHNIFSNLKLCIKISWQALIARFVPHTGCGPNSIYKRIKLCEKQFWSFIAWPFSGVAYCSVGLHTAWNLHW